MPSGVQGTNRGVPAASSPKLAGWKAIDVLLGRDAFDDDRLVNLPWKWKLDQDSVYSRVGIEAIDRRKQISLPCLNRKAENGAGHPGGLARGRFISDIHLAGGVFADQNDCQTRGDAGLGHERRSINRDPPANLRRESFPIQDLSRHREFPPPTSRRKSKSISKSEITIRSKLPFPHSEIALVPA